MSNLLLSLAVSSHLGLVGDYNEVHPHVRYENRNVIAGAYYNSVDRFSAYLGHRMERGDAGLEIAMVTGYNEINYVVPSLRATYDIDNIRVFTSPIIEEYNDDYNFGVVFGVEYQFK